MRGSGVESKAMPEYHNDKSASEITALLSGKVLERVEHVDDRENSIVRFVFTDGTMLELEYDWMYEWKVNKGKA